MGFVIILCSSSYISNCIFRVFVAALYNTAYIVSLLALGLGMFSFSRDSIKSGFELYLDSLKKLAVFRGLNRMLSGERGIEEVEDCINFFSCPLSFQILYPSRSISLFKSRASVIALRSSHLSVDMPAMAKSGVSIKGTSLVRVLLSNVKLLSSSSS